MNLSLFLKNQLILTVQEKKFKNRRIYRKSKKTFSFSKILTDIFPLIITSIHIILSMYTIYFFLKKIMSYLLF